MRQASRPVVAGLQPARFDPETLPKGPSFTRMNATPAATFNVRDYGATGNGTAKDTPAIAKTIEACAQAGGGTIFLRGNMTLEVDAGATILGSGEPSGYSLRDSAFGDGRKEYSSLIYAEDAENVTIRGRGTIDGQGQYWWRRMAWPNRLKIPREQRTPDELAQLALLANGRPQLEQLHLINSPSWTIHPQLCEFVRIDGVTIRNPVPSPDTDGINPESCRNVQISNSRIDVGDDSVTLKSGIQAQTGLTCNQRERHYVPGCHDRYRKGSGADYDELFEYREPPGNAGGLAAGGCGGQVR
jgi:polygalacturonase